MSRQIAVMLALAVGAIGFTIVADDKDESPDKPPQFLYLFAVNVEGVPSVHIDLGDRSLFAPKLQMKLKGNKSDYEIIASDDELVMRQKTEKGFKDLGRNRQIAIPLQPKAANK